MNNIYQQKKVELQAERDSFKSTRQKVIRWFPLAGEFLRMEKLCRTIGLAKEHIYALFSKKTILYTGDLYSEEHKRKFSTQNSQIKIDKDANKQLSLSIDRSTHSDWFKGKWDDVKRSLNIRNTNNRSKGVKL